MRNKFVLLLVIFSLVILSGANAQIACNFGQCAYTFSGNVQIPNSCGIGGAMLAVGKGTGANDPSIITAGSVGIGLPNPSQSLEVIGNIRVSGNLYISPAGNHYITTDAANVLTIKTIGTDRLTLSPNPGGRPNPTPLGGNPQGTTILNTYLDVEGSIWSKSSGLYLTGLDGSKGAWIMSGPDEGCVFPGCSAGQLLNNNNADNVIGWIEGPDHTVEQRKILLLGDTYVGMGSTTGFASRNLFVKGNINAQGKIHADGGVDPPYISFSDQSHESIRQYAKSVDSHEKVMQFWNGKSHRMEVYVIAEDKFYSIDGKLILD